MTDTKHIRRGFHSIALGHAPGVGLWGDGGAGGTQGVKKKNFKHGHVAYQIDGYGENANKIFILGSNW